MKTIFRASVSMAAISAIAFALPATAQETVPQATQEDERTLERVVVTGSFIRRPDQSSLASPISVVGALEIGAIGAQSIADITQTLTINTGAQNNPDAFTQGGTTGTANINLRGLGLQSTLVLTNGKRNVLNSSTTNDGISFVDTNSLVPLIAVDRLEILKDGASSLYGSDAVAGVVNFITLTDYDGIKFSSDYQFHTPGGQNQSEYRIEGLVGKTFDRGSVLLSAGFFDRSALTTEERRLSVPFGVNQDVSNLGNPGAFFIGPTPFIDPTGCADEGGNPLFLAPPGVGPAGTDIGLCQFDFGDFFNLVPDEQRLNVYGEVKYDVTDNIEFSINGSYTDINSERGNSPTFPFLQPAVVLGDTPTNAFSDLFGAPTDVSFFGRAIGNGGTVSPGLFNSETYRFAATLKSEEFLKNGFWELSYTRGQNDFLVRTEDTVTSRFQCSLNGLQGTAAGNPSTGGTTDCSSGSLFADGLTIPTGEIFNPFATSFSTLPNSPELLDFIIGTQVADSRSQIDVVDAVFGTDIIDLPSGPLAIAAGAQYRNDSLRTDFDEISNADGFGFLIGNDDFSGSNDVYAFFLEASVPLLSWLDLSAAVRYEDFGGTVGSTVDPKVSLLARPFDGFAIRGTYSTSFRSPTVFQTQGSSTSLNQVVDPSGGTAFAAVRAFGSDVAGLELSPETSTAYTAGFTFERDNFVFNFDYYDFSFRDAITQESFQALVNANPTDARDFVNGVATEACLAEFTVVCRAGNAINGQITQVNTQFVNADSIDTSGVDYSFKYAYDAGKFGVVTPSFEGTVIITYDIDDPSVGIVNGLGSRNQSNIGSPTPQSRWNAGFGYSNGPVFGNFFARRIGGFTDDQNGDIDIPGQTRFDIQAGIDVSSFIGFSESSIFTVQVTNLTDEEPPFVATNGGFESRVSDPRGRLVRFGFRAEF